MILNCANVAFKLEFENNEIKTKLWSPNIGAMKKEARGLRPIRSKMGE